VEAEGPLTLVVLSFEKELLIEFTWYRLREPETRPPLFLDFVVETPTLKQGFLSMITPVTPEVILE